MSEPLLSNSLMPIYRFTPAQISVVIHGLIVFLVILSTIDFSHQSKINFDVIDIPINSPNLTLQPKNQVQPKPIVEPIKKSKAVFGVNRKAITTSDAEAVSVKQGNTVAKENDDQKLADSDAESLPIPADDYLVTTGAKLISSVQANRTDEARKAGYIGTAILLILIDQMGLVRDVQSLNQLEFGLTEKAITIAKQLKFMPAKVKDEPVAIKIRFSINFKSSN